MNKKLAELMEKVTRSEEAIEKLKIILKEAADPYNPSFYVITPADATILNLAIEALEQQSKIGHCKDCKYFELDCWRNVNGIPLIVAHKICNRWGEGCKTKEDGYCFMFEPKESEGDKE